MSSVSRRRKAISLLLLSSLPPFAPQTPPLQTTADPIQTPPKPNRKTKTHAKTRKKKRGTRRKSAQRKHQSIPNASTSRIHGSACSWASRPLVS
ncbi:hypothetical protein LZ30DRAFT_474798 [Colletotrichum cereale]|nr:hypothetical protein LZ30DRAFT_474798 [Colletotrichum cereale]